VKISRNPHHSTNHEYVVIRIGQIPDLVESLVTGLRMAAQNFRQLPAKSTLLHDLGEKTTLKTFQYFITLKGDF
jgi:hypothetical protein